MTENPIENALSKGTFSIVAAVQGSGTTYPTADVVVNSDLGTAYEIAKLDKEAAIPGTDAEKINALDAQIAELREQMKPNSYTFHMRGISPGTQKAIDEEYPVKDGDYFKHNLAHLAAHVIRVTDAEGNVDEHKFTAEDLETVASWLPASEFEKLYNKMNELSFQANYIDQALSADFLSKP